VGSLCVANHVDTEHLNCPLSRSPPETDNQVVRAVNDLLIVAGGPGSGARELSRKR